MHKFIIFIPLFIIFALLVGFMNTNGNDPKKGKQNIDPKLVNYNFIQPIEYRSPNAILKYVDSLNGDNTIAGLTSRGYLTYFNGTPPPGTSIIWYQGSPNTMGYWALNGPDSGFVQSDYNSIVSGNIDNWLIFPKVNISTGDSLFFYSGSYNSAAYPDSIRVMYSSVGDSLPDAVSWVELGRFRVTSYMPNSIIPWARKGFRAPSSGTGRFAIRYCVFDGGPNGANSSSISIDYIRIISYAGYPLNTFNLLIPSTGVTVTSINGSTTPITIIWDTSASGATYKFKYVSTTGPSRSLTIPVGTNSISSTLGALDGILAGIGLNPGDSTIGQWDVWAFKSPNALGPDSLKSTNGPRAITLKRYKPTLNSFTLVSPVSGTTITTAGGSGTQFISNWTQSGVGATYKWFYASPNFSSPANIKLRIPSDNSGLDSTLTKSLGAMNVLLTGIGVNLGDSTVGQWRIYAYSGTDSLASTATNNITFKRSRVITVGTGNIPSEFPFTTYWNDGRTQYLYLASEFVGIGSPAYINTIAFDVLTIGSPTLTDFKVSFKNTDSTSLNNFDNDGLIACYNSTSWAPSEIGWNIITLTTQFNYNPTKNLLIDICYNNTTWTSYSTVSCSYAPGMYYGRYNDLADPLGGCGYTAWTLTAGPVGRANTQFGISNLISVTNSSNNIPENYSLSQNYPNPFNPVTKINFAIPKQGFVSLKIYDMLGREVKTLVNEVRQAGYFSVDFNASEYASGVYFYRLETKNFTDVKKMMLIK